MKRRIFAALLAGAMILSLAACGGGSGGSSDPGSGSDVSAIAPGGSSSQPDGSTPDGSPVVTPDPVEVTLTLNKTEVTLNKAGATFQLRYTAEPDVLNSTPVYGTSNTEVATVTADGIVTAVAPGTAVITVEYGSAAAECTVTCDWKVSEPAPKPEPKPDPKPDTSKPDPKPDTSKPDASKPDTSAPAQVDLSGFYSTITGKYQFAFMDAVGDEIIDQRYAGLTGLSLSQRLVYQCLMSPSPNGDFVLIQVSDSKDVDTVKSILQARIDYMVGDGNGPGGAFYPMEQTTWEEYSRIAVNGNYLMLIAHENCDDIVKEFNALF